MANKIMTAYEKSIRRGEAMIIRYMMEYPTYDQPADLIADILAYCQEKGIDFDSEVKLAKFHIKREQAE